MSTENEQVDYLSLSDEEIMNMGFPPSEQEEEISPNQELDEEESSDESASESESDDNQEDDDDIEEEDENTDDEEDSEDSENESKESDTVNYAELYGQIMAPFKANGKEITPRSVEDVVLLMKKGAGFTKKMQALKPQLKILKMLENNNLLDEAKLNYLIDLNAKNPAAITKLIKESKIDPMDVDLEAEDNYTPQSHAVSDTEMDIEEVLSTIKESSSYDRTINTVTKTWDATSRQLLSSNPSDIAVINAHMEDGTFDKVWGQVEEARNFDRLPMGISDFEAYMQVGQAMYKAGQLDMKPQKESNEQAPPINQQEKNNNESKRKAQKKSLSPNKTIKTPKKSLPDNILGLSDEEFEKLGGLGL